MYWMIGSNVSVVHWISWISGAVVHWFKWGSSALDQLDQWCSGSLAYVVVSLQWETFCRHFCDPANKLINGFLRMDIVLN